MLPKEDQCIYETYEKELKIIFGAICDGFRQEVQYRQLMVLQFPTEQKENFPLDLEKERGLVNVMAFHIRMAGFLVRMENWWCDNDEDLKNKTPDLDIWLPKTTTDFVLEVKRIDADVPLESAKNRIKKDLDKLLRAEIEENRYSGILAFGFADNDKQQVELRNKYDDISSYIENYDKNSFRKLGLETVSFKDIVNSKPKSARVGLWFRPRGITN